MRPVSRKLLLIFSAAVFVGIIWEFAGLQGEVFLVTSDGKSFAAPGAEIWVLRTNKDRNMAGLLTKWIAPAKEQLLRSLQDSTRKLVKVRELAERRSINGENEERAIAALAQLQLAANRNFCNDVHAAILTQVGSQGVWATADRNGRFSIRLLPGHYIVGASGQAGKSHAEWAEEVQIFWRSYARLANPVCEYNNGE